MNERERWIVYPLLFLALGAALRDSFRQRVTTDELVTKRIVCEELSVRDPSKENRVVAKLTSGAPDGLSQNADRFGVLWLIDSEGRELCGVTNNALQVRQISCDEMLAKTVSVVDPQNAQRRLALMTSATARSQDGATRSVGSLLLTDSEGTAIFGLANDQMQMRNIVCQGIAVVDPEQASRVLAVLGSAILKSTGRDPQTKRVGVLQLNDQRLIGLTGDPTEAPVDAPPPPSAAPAADNATEDAAQSGDEDQDGEADAKDGAPQDEPRTEAEPAIPPAGGDDAAPEETPAGETDDATPDDDSDA